MDAVVIVDGLNLHHALLDFGLAFTRPDIVKLGSKLLERKYQQIGFYYFTSAPQHRGKEEMDAYLLLVEKLKLSGVEVTIVVSQTSSFLRYSPISLGGNSDAVIRLRPELIYSCQFET